MERGVGREHNLMQRQILGVARTDCKTSILHHEYVFSFSRTAQRATQHASQRILAPARVLPYDPSSQGYRRLLKTTFASTDNTITIVGQNVAQSPSENKKLTLVVVTRNLGTIDLHLELGVAERRYPFPITCARQNMKKLREVLRVVLAELSHNSLIRLLKSIRPLARALEKDKLMSVSYC